MPNDTVSEVVTRPFVSAAGTGSYTGVESIVQTDQTVTLDLSKQLDLAVGAQGGMPRFTIDESQSLSMTITKTATQVTADFSLNVFATVAITRPDGTVNPFNANLSIQGTVTFTPQTGCYHIDYKGGWCDANLGCDGSGGLPRGALSIDNAATSFAFDNPGADGSAFLLIDHNAVQSPASFAEAPDPATAAQGALALRLAASALEAAFGARSEDPVQGYDHADGDVLRAMGNAALTMIGAPDDQDAAANAVVAATVAGARLAMIDGLAAYDVAAAHQGPIALSGPGDILLG